jgi:FlaA1/EpsC-like NDP-sugar epimerase
MGDQIKGADMARNLIRLSGLSPDEDIKISYVGLRPGEKLYEELIGMRETVQPSSIQKVFEVCGGEPRPSNGFRTELRRLERYAKAGETSKVVASLHHLVPEFTGRPWEIAPEAVGKLRTRTAAISLLTTPQDFPADVVLSS